LKAGAHSAWAPWEPGGAQYAAPMTQPMGSSAVTDSLVTAALAVTLSVRSRRGLVDDELRELYAALTACAADWASLDAIPRAAVNALVDLEPSLLASAELYDQSTRAVIIDTAIEIADLVHEAVAVPSHSSTPHARIERNLGRAVDARTDSEHRRATFTRWLGQRNRRQEDPSYRDEWYVAQCGRCGFWVGLTGGWGHDFGACSNARSPSDGMVRFEHDGCDAFSAEAEEGRSGPISPPQ